MSATAQLLDQLGLDESALPIIEWHRWVMAGIGRRTTVQLVSNDHADTLAVVFVLPDGSEYPVPGVNTPGAGPVVEFGYFDLDQLNLRLTNSTRGVEGTATYPNPGQIRREPIAGTDAAGAWVGYRWSLEDRPPTGPFPGDGDFNDVVLDVKSYPDLLDPSPSEVTELVGTWQRDLDRSWALASYTVTHGRGSAYVNTEPLSATVSLARALMGDELPQVGERFRLSLSPAVADALGIPEADRPRFTGEVTDPVVDTEGLVQLTAVGRSARLGRVTIDNPMPRQSAGRRVARTLALAVEQLPTLDVGYIELDGPDLMVQLEPENAQALIDAATTASTGQLVEDRAGVIRWHGVDHRRGRVPRVALDGAVHLIKPFSWEQHAGTVVNAARVTWGDTSTPGAGGVVTVTDPNSADVETGLGPYGVDLTTALADASDAQALGSLLVGRRALPRWELPTVTADVVRTAADRAGMLLRLGHGDKLDVSSLPVDGPWTSSAVFVEQTTETFQPRAWRLTLALSDPAVSGVALRWVDLPQLLAWEDVAPTLRWLDVAALPEGDAAGLGAVQLDAGAPSTTPDAVLDGGTPTTTSWSSTYTGGTP